MKAITSILLLLSVGLKGMSQRIWDHHMRLQSITIDIKANHFKASTFIEMEFFNPSEKEIEGLYEFRLNPGQVITAFQLDLFGHYRDGSIEEKWKATNAYNTIVGKKIDPALLTMHANDAYNLRIYPVPARSTRKITMTIEEVMTADQNKFNYQLPFNIQEKIASVAIKIKAPDTINIEADLFKNNGLSKTLEDETIVLKGDNISLKSPISFSFPFKESVQIDKRNGRFALQIQPDLSVLPKINYKKLTVLWDASGSANQRDITKEINFLKQYVLSHNISEMTLIAFNHKELFRKKIKSPSVYKTWATTLKQIDYSGATQFGSIDLSDSDTDLTLIFSDGHNTWGKKSISGLKGMVFAVHSSLHPNQRNLEELIGTSGGHVINLLTKSIEEAVMDGNNETVWLLSIKSASGKTTTDQKLPLRLDQPLLISGLAPFREKRFYLEYGSSRQQSYIKEITFSSDITVDISRLDMLAAFSKTIHSADWEMVLDFGIKEKIVTPHTAYIVLERVEDYARYKIAPPKELEEACRKINYVWSDTRLQRQQKRKNDEYTILLSVVDAYNKRIRQWDNTATPLQFDRSDYESINQTAAPQINTNTNALKNELMGAAAGIAIERNNALEEIIVTGYGVSAKKMLMSSVTVVTSYELNSFQNITQALQGRVPGVQILSSGQPGNTPFVNIRGAASLNPNNQPLWVLDGFPVHGNIDELISSFDIENITVLKDMSAAAIYGSRAAFGAIVIKTKKGNNNQYYRDRSTTYRLKDMEDAEYIATFNELSIDKKKIYYTETKKRYGGQTGFFFDMAQLFFKTGMIHDARETLMEAIETGKGNKAVLIAAGYILEDWKLFKEAIQIYKELNAEYPDNLQHCRNLAWSYYQNTQYQEAVNTLFTGIKKDIKDDGLKVVLLTEMNAIIGAHKHLIDVSAIPAAIIFNMPVDFRLVLSSNTGKGINAFIKEPVKNADKAGQFIHQNYWFPYAEYQQKQTMPGKYRFGLKYYDYTNPLAPNYVRKMTFTNFGKPGQLLKIENVVMDNQWGEVEIADWKM